jgi:hypothetical protein
MRADYWAALSSFGSVLGRAVAAYCVIAPFAVAALFFLLAVAARALMRRPAVKVS